MTKKYIHFLNRGKPQTIAEKLEKDFNSLPRLENGDVGGMRKFRQKCWKKGDFYEDCPESFDSSRIYIFLDGSRGYLGNPCQEAFTAFFYAMKAGKKGF